MIPQLSAIVVSMVVVSFADSASFVHLTGGDT
jgi:hypothetical protein